MILTKQRSKPIWFTLDLLKQIHSSHPRDLLIADVCFKGGLIDSWGCGTIRIFESCKEAGLTESEGGFLVSLCKNNLTEELLVKLNIRQIKVISYMKSKGKITNAEYQEINNVRRELQPMI